MHSDAQRGDARARLEALVGRPFLDSPSPVGRWLQGTVRDVREGALTFEYTVREEMTNPFGVLHGGMIAAMMDDLIGTTLFSMGQTRFFASINLSIDFLSTARNGDVVTARTRVVRKGRSVLNLECTLHSAGGDLIARGVSNLLYAGRSRPDPDE